MTDDAKVVKEVSYIGERLREKSTYAGLTIMVSMMLPLAAKYLPQLGSISATDIVNAMSMIGIGVGSLIAILLPERGSK